MMAEVQGEGMRTVLLVGRTGNGKSSVGNSILGENKFTMRSNHQFGAPLKNQVSTSAGVKVVDCTGLGDTGSDMVGDVQSVIQSAREAVEQCDPWFHALIFVIKYGVRFTKQEKDAVQMVKSIFGEYVFRDWGILVFSYGDSFYLDTEDDEITFENWCREQTGDIKTLFEEVGYRCVLFDNKTRDTNKQRKQREELMGWVEKIQDNKRASYSLPDFVKAKHGHEELIVGEEFKTLKTETEEIIRKMNHSLERKPVPLDHEIQLETLLLELMRHEQKLKEKDRDTGILKSLQTQVRVQVTLLQDKLILLKPKIGEMTDDFQKLKLHMRRETIQALKNVGSFLFQSFRQ